MLWPPRTGNPRKPKNAFLNLFFWFFWFFFCSIDHLKHARTFLQQSVNCLCHLKRTQFFFSVFEKLPDDGLKCFLAFFGFLWVLVDFWCFGLKIFFEGFPDFWGIFFEWGNFRNFTGFCEKKFFEEIFGNFGKFWGNLWIKIFFVWRKRVSQKILWGS